MLDGHKIADLDAVVWLFHGAWAYAARTGSSKRGLTE
jgi:hypothetical protein